NRGIGTFCKSRVEWINVVLLRFDVEGSLELLELLRVLLRQIVRLAEIFVDVIQLPLEIVRIRFRPRCYPRESKGGGAGHPPVLVNRAIAKHFEILDRVPRRGLGVGKSVDQADAIHRLLASSVHYYRSLDSGGLVNRRNKVDDMTKLLAQTSLVP